MFELLNQPPNKRQAYVGRLGFRAQGRAFTSRQWSRTRAPTSTSIPRLVGNHRRVLVSDLSGRSNVLYKAKEWGVDLDSKDPQTSAILVRLKELESQGFEFEGAEASFELLMQDATDKAAHPRLSAHRLPRHRRKAQRRPRSPSTEATVQIEVDGHVEHTAALGNGPVNALDVALRKALEKFFPELKEVQSRRLQSAGARRRARYRHQGSGATRKRRRHRPLGHGRRVRQHPRSLVPGAGRCHPLQAFQGQTAARVERRRSLPAPSRTMRRAK